jgi:hypothetical protein
VSRTEVRARDGDRCISCDHPAGHPLPLAVHTRILGDHDDDRPSNKLTLCGTGNLPPGCHGLAHSSRKVFGDPRHYIVSRYGARSATLAIPVWYNQPSLGRVGWYLLDDDYGLTLVESPGD